MKIRRELQGALERVAIEGFVDRLLDHLQVSFPRHRSVATEEDLRNTIRLGLDRARGYGITYQRGVCRYVELMLMLGSGFDVDPQLPWAARILGDSSEADEVSRIDQLHAEASDYLRDVASDYRDLAGTKGNRGFLRELRRIRREGDDPLSPDIRRELIERLMAWIARVFPRKCQYVGEDDLRRLIRSGVASAEQYGMATVRGGATYVGMMMVLGSGFDVDPLLPWAGAILKDQSRALAARKVDRLSAEALSHLRRWLNSGKV
jgi:hypothetical protein